MKYSRHKALDLLIVLIASSALLISVVQGKERFLQSSSFESLSPLQKTPTGWYMTVIPEYSDYMDFIWDKETSYKDKMSISIRIHKDHPEDRDIAYNWYTDVQNWEVGKDYELSCWVKGEGLKDTAWICIQCWDESMTEMLNFSTTQKDYFLKGSFDWQQVGTVFIVPKGTYKVIVRAGIAAPKNNGGQVWFDEMHIRELIKSDE
jgi:hypothetical protein